MKQYIWKRVLTGALVVLFSVLFNFVLMRLAPGDPTRLLAGKENPNPATILALQERYGLNKPIMVQFVLYIKQLLHGDFGFSYVSNRPVLTIIGERFGATILLAVVGLIIEITVGILLGVHAAQHQGSKFDTILNGISYFFDSTPAFWLGLMIILLFSSTLHLLPTSGMYNVRENYQGFRRVLDVGYHMILPTLTMVVLNIPYYFRITRSSVMETMNEDYIMTLRSTGMPEKQIFRKYVLRNALLPIITVVGITMAYMITGVAFIEIVFAWPGMGRLMLNSITTRDYPVLSGIYLLLSISVAVMMIVVDVVYAYADPRIRYED